MNTHKMLFTDVGRRVRVVRVIAYRRWWGQLFLTF